MPNETCGIVTEYKGPTDPITGESQRWFRAECREHELFRGLERDTPEEAELDVESHRRTEMRT